jgi:hypothetical protein
MRNAQQKPKPQPSPRTPFLADSDALAATIFTLGTGLWKGLAAWSNIDFLLSIKEETFSTMFEFFENTGWFIALIIGIFILVFQWKKPTEKRSTVPTWGLVFSISLVSFLFGILLAVRSSGGIPKVIDAWGAQPPLCAALIETSRLITFANKYKIAFVCGIPDATQDKFEDDRVTVSNLFTITPNPVAIVAPYSGRMQVFAKSLSGPDNKAISTWYEAILLPSDVSSDKITKLSDVVKLGGKIIDPAYYK